LSRKFGILDVPQTCLACKASYRDSLILLINLTKIVRKEIHCVQCTDENAVTAFNKSIGRFKSEHID
jgi:hypothetical protein